MNETGRLRARTRGHQVRAVVIASERAQLNGPWKRAEGRSTDLGPRGYAATWKKSSIKSCWRAETKC
jgi:hypothetical protein